jgi:hypothetical protein
MPNDQPEERLRRLTAALTANKRPASPAPPRPEVVRDAVRALAQDTANIRWRKHAQDRMIERDITDQMALEVMRKGYVKGVIEAGKNLGLHPVPKTPS